MFRWSLQRLTGVWRVVALLVAVASLTLGGWLIHDHLASRPPNPADADIDHVVSFFLSDYFDRLSEDAQRRYVQRMVNRYAAMDADQQAVVDAAVREQRDTNRDRVRERMMQMWKGYMVSEAERYVDIPPDEREAWLEGRMRMWERMTGGRSQRGGQRGQRPEDRELTEQRQRQIVQFFQDDVLPRTTARERALVSVLVRDVAAAQGNRW